MLTKTDFGLLQQNKRRKQIMDKHETKPVFASTNQVLDVQRLITEQLFKMPKNIADEILRSNASRKAFMKKVGEAAKCSCRFKTTTRFSQNHF